MNERLKQVRQSSGLTQQQFADSINVSRNYIALMEIGQREPSDRTISDICRVYAVNEIWLRTGVGEMKLPLSQNEQLAKIFAAVQVSDDERARLIKAFASLPPEAYPQIYQWFKAFAENLKT